MPQQRQQILNALHSPKTENTPHYIITSISEMDEKTVSKAAALQWWQVILREQKKQQLQADKKSETIPSCSHTDQRADNTTLIRRGKKSISKTRGLFAYRNRRQVNSVNLYPSSHEELNTSISKGAHLLVTLPHLRDHTGCSDADDRPSALWCHCHQWESHTYSAGVSMVGC